MSYIISILPAIRYCTETCECACECHADFAVEEAERVQDEELKQLGIQALPAKLIRRFLGFAMNHQARHVYILW